MLKWLPKSGEGLFNSLRTAGSRLFKEYASGASLLTDLRAGGVEIATSMFYKIRRQVLGLTRYEEQIKTLLPGTLIPKSWTDVEHGLSLSGEYLYRLRYDIIDPDIGKVDTAFVSLLSNEQLTVLDIKEKVLLIIDETPTSQPTTIENLEVFQAMQKPG